jgi:hypothetical protein
MGFILEQKHATPARILVATGNFIAHASSGCVFMHAVVRADERTEPVKSGLVIVAILTTLVAIISGVLLCLQHMTSFLMVSLVLLADRLPTDSNRVS